MGVSCRRADLEAHRAAFVDRVGDTEQVSVGVTSRILDVATGRELVSATIGQTRYFEAGKGTLPDELPNSLSASNYIAERAVCFDGSD